jgi:hypothetical protein
VPLFLCGFVSFSVVALAMSPFILTIGYIDYVFDLDEPNTLLSAQKQYFKNLFSSFPR